MGGPHIFGLPAALRKPKAMSVRPIPQTPTERRVQPLASDVSPQAQNDDRTSPNAQGSRAEYNQMGFQKGVGFGSVSANDMATDSGTLLAAGGMELGHLSIIVHPKASSPLLGNQDYETSYNSESRVGQTARSLRGCGSSSTLRSFYDSQKIPLAVSQQTSNSSARDFALRKGCPPVVAIEKPFLRSPPSQNPCDATLRSAKKTSSIRLDLSMLFPKPSAHHDHHISSRLGRGHTNLPAELVMPPAVPLGPSTSQKTRANNANKAPQPLRQFKEPIPRLKSTRFSKANMRKPRGGTKHWFDRFEDDDFDDFERQEKIEFRSPTEFSRRSRPPIHIVPAEFEAYNHNPDNTSLHHERCDPIGRSNQSSLQIPPAREPRTVSPAREQLRLALQNWEFRSKHHQTRPANNSTTELRSSRSKPFDKVDLHKNSVLWLSSSEDESEADDSLQYDIGTTIPGIRDSLIVTSSDISDVEIGTAHAIKTERPTLENDFTQRRSQSHISRIFESPLKHVQVPERQSSKMFSFLSDQSRSPPNAQEGSLATSSIIGASSELVGNYLDSSPTISQKNDSFIKLMTVTPQEESLLEAIRLKRASMRQGINGKTFRRTSGSKQGESTSPYPRPRTSGLEGNSASFLHLSQDSMPTSSAIHNHRRSISAGEVLEFNGMEPRTSGSTDPMTSHRGSLVHSSLPSTSSQESPPTPTLEPEPDNSTRGTGSSTKRYSTFPTNYQRHSRARTGSSAVIVLDNLEDDSSSHFKLDDLPIWAFNGWPDTPSLAVVH